MGRKRTRVSPPAQAARQPASPQPAAADARTARPAETELLAKSAPALGSQLLRVGDAQRASLILGLQHSHGNQTVQRLIQRHSSWEHALLGDTPPKALGNAAVKNEDKIHVVFQEWQRMRFFAADAGADPRQVFPDIRWIQLKGSKLWLSYGELNALSDYMPDPGTADSLDREKMVPVLQQMRQGIADAAGAVMGLSGGWQSGHAWSVLPGAAGEVKALDKATADLGTNRYMGLVARNACHFPPFSWQRWTLFHNEARTEALAHWADKKAVTALKDVSVETEEHERQAWLKNGYGDHFLQDSFASGHLIDKTLVMQWFVEYLNSLDWIHRPWFGLPDAEVMANMTTQAQPGIAGQSLYGTTPSSADTSSGDRLFGSGVADPQTAQERDRREKRIAGSGVVATRGRTQEQNYQAYLRFLNNSFLQKASGATHDYFNERGLRVATADGKMEYTVGGDDTLLAKSDELGAETASQAAHLSQQTIQDLLTTGQSDVTVEQIFALLPQIVISKGADGKETRTPLGEWQEGVLHQICISEIFPHLVDTMSTNTIVRGASPKMVSSGVSVDAGSAPPPPTPSSPPGDYEPRKPPAGAGSAYV